MDRIPHQDLIAAALRLMERRGKPLTRVQTGTRAMVYTLPDGKTVRLRTCNDPVLVVLASSPGNDARLNIEGTDHLLIVMPEVPRTPGSIVAYLIPTDVAVNDVKEAHVAWLASGPKTKGDNRTWNVWFKAGPPGCSGFAKRWATYFLGSESESAKNEQNERVRAPSLGEVIARARIEIATAAGVAVDNVKISVVVD